MKNSVMLIFPPGWGVAEPYLALPQLKGYANSLNEDVEICDNNIDFFDHILTNDFFTAKFEFCKNKFESYKSKNSLSEAELEEFHCLYRGLKYADRLSDIDALKSAIRKTKNKNDYVELYTILSSALEIIGFYYHMKISFMGNISSNVYQETTYRNLLLFSEDKRNNIFYDYYLENGLIEKWSAYDVVGISVTSMDQIYSAFTIINLLNQQKNPPQIFLGGHFITHISKNLDRRNLAKSILQHVSFVSIFEGEPLIKNLCSDNFNYRDCDNVIYLDNGQIIRNSIYLGDDIKKAILPNFDGFSLNKYFCAELMLPILSSRNCYNNCAFCTLVQSGMGNKYITYNLDDVIDNIIRLKNKYGTNNFTFNDEVFALKRMAQFSQKMNHSGVSINWLSETRFDVILSKGEYKDIYDSGCKCIQFGLESYNQRVLDIMNKNVSISNIDDNVMNAMEAGIAVHLFCIVGFPTETREEANNTKKYIQRFLQKAAEYHSNSTVQYRTFNLDEGCEVFNNPSKFGVIIKGHKSEFDFCSSFEYLVLSGLSPQEATEIKQSIYHPNPLAIDLDLPHNVQLITELDTTELAQHSDHVFQIETHFNILTGEELDSLNYYYHKINEDILLSSIQPLNASSL